LLIVQAEGPESYREVYQEQEITRLGEGLNQKGCLLPEPMQRTAEVLVRFAQKAVEWKAEKIYAVATSAVREADNGAEFVEMVRQRAGLQLEVISPAREAELALNGVLQVIEPGDNSLLVIDIGGGSTEFILAEQKKLKDFLSLNLGVVKLTEAFLKTDPVAKADYERLCHYIDQALEAVDLVPQAQCMLVGTAGTVTTLAAVAQQMSVYDPTRINGYVLSGECIRSIQDRFLAQTLALRRKTPGLEPARADVIVAGTAILSVFLAKFGFSEIVACDQGLREGIIHDKLKENFSTH